MKGLEMLDSLRRNVAWRAIPIAGAAAGTVFLLAALILTPLLYQLPPTLMLRYFASLVMGESVLVGSGGGGLVVGVLVHYALSMLAALVIAVVVHRWGMLIGIGLGALLGLAIYGINFYSMTRFFPWFFAISGTVMLICHVLFGAVAGGVYERLDRFDVPLKEVPHVQK